MINRKQRKLKKIRLKNTKRLFPQLRVDSGFITTNSGTFPYDQEDIIIIRRSGSVNFTGDFFKKITGRY